MSFTIQQSAPWPEWVPGKTYKYPIIGEITDVDGRLWWVRQIRETKHGFDLYFGTPASRALFYPTGLPAIIATQDLLDYWEANKTRQDKTLFDLPAGRTTLKRVRQRYGFHVVIDKDDFFREHIDDLRILSITQFAAKHGLNPCVVAQARIKTIGRTARQVGWWREPRVINILLSRLTLREMGEKLGVGTSQAWRLRERGRAEQLQQLAA
jgi:hypothetical protein